MTEALWWNELEIFSRSIGSLPYRDYRIEIFESKRFLMSNDDENKRTRYFYTPITLLRPKSAEIFTDESDEEHIISFEVDMWNDEIQEKVVNFISSELKLDVDQSQISVIPFGELRLISKLKRTRANSNWIKYQSHQSITFELIGSTKDEIDSVMDMFTSNARRLQNKFLIEFALSARKSQTNEISISIEHVMRGQLFSKLNQQFASAQYALLSAEDKNTLLNESINNVIVETRSDMNEASNSDIRERVQRALDKLLGFSRETVNQDSATIWQSVFWKDENCRPDKVVHTLNEFIKKADKETKDNLVSNVNNNSQTSSDLHLDLQLGKLVKVGKGGIKHDTSSSGSSSHDNKKLFKLNTEDLSRINFDGEKFVPKSMELYRMNLGMIRNRQSYRDSSVNVYDSAGVLTLSVNVPKEEADQKTRDKLAELEQRISRIETSMAKELEEIRSFISSISIFL